MGKEITGEGLGKKQYSLTERGEKKGAQPKTGSILVVFLFLKEDPWGGGKGYIVQRSLPTVPVRKEFKGNYAREKKTMKETAVRIILWEIWKKDSNTGGDTDLRL